ncbi:type II toxin-antitoxin system YafQ family toxin [Streptococcus suis]
MPYDIIYTTAFKKDIKKAKKRGKNLDKLFQVVDLLINDLPLPEHLRDHSLSGNWVNTRECHLEPDWLLIYEKRETQLVLILTRTGSHSDLF